MLAAAGLARLQIASWPGLEFRYFPTSDIVPAVAQGAIAIQCRTADAARLAPLFDLGTARAVQVERALQQALGGGCQSALGVHVDGLQLDFFHEKVGSRSAGLTEADVAAPGALASRLLTAWGLI